MSRNVMLAIVLLAVIWLPAVAGASGDVPLHGILTPVFTGGGAGHGVYYNEPPHGIILGPVGPGHGIWIVPVVAPGGGVQIANEGGLAPVTDMSLLYPDFSPQGTIEAARRGEGWPWQAPLPLQTPEMRDLGVTSYWQGIVAFQQLFASLDQAGPGSWKERVAQCAETRGLFDWYVKAPGKLTPAQLLSLGQAGLKLLETPPAPDNPQTLKPEAAGFPAELSPITFRNAAERDALVGALQVSAQPGTPDPALWGIWALYLGAVQTPQSAAALAPIIGGGLMFSNSTGPWETVSKLPGGPRYMWGLSLSLNGLTATAEKAVPDDNYAVKTALAQVEQAGDHVGYTLVGANYMGPEADFLFASQTDPGAGWYVRSLWAPGGVLPADLSTSGDQSPGAVSRQFGALLRGVGPFAHLRTPQPHLEYLGQSLDAQGVAHYYKLEGGRWRAAQLAVAVAG